MVKFEKGSKMFEMFRDYYILIQEFWEPNEGDAFWDAFNNRSTEFIKKYDMEQYPRDLVQDLVAELERRMKKS